MSITVRELLEIESFEGFKVIAGHSSLNKPIEYVNVMDTLDITKYLKGQDLLLIGNIAKTNPEISNDIVERASTKNVSAIGCKFFPCLGGYPPEMIVQAEEHGIVLIDMSPKKGPWTDIMYPVYNAILEKKNWTMKRSIFLHNLVFGNISEKEQILANADFLNLNLSSEFYVVIFNLLMGDNPSEKTENDREILIWLQWIENRMIGHFSNIISFKINNSLVTLVANKTINLNQDIHIKVKQLIVELRKKASCSISVGMSRSYPAEKIHIGFKEAQAAVKLGSTVADIGYFADFNELGLYRLLTSVENTQEFLSFYSSSLKPLVLFDRQNGTEYTHTLEIFLRHGTKDASEQLFIHANTLRYRLSKIEEITGKTLSDYDDRLTLQIGLILEKLIESKSSVY